MEFDNLIQIRCSDFDHSLNIYSIFDDVLLNLMCFLSPNKLDYHIKAINGNSKNNLDKLTFSFKMFENQNVCIEPMFESFAKNKIKYNFNMVAGCSH